MQDRNASSFNLQNTSSIAHKLADRNPSSTSLAAKPQTGTYLSWPSTTAAVSGITHPANQQNNIDASSTSRSEVEVKMPRAPSVDNVEALLEWGIGVLDAVGAFVVDPQGFVIGTAGETPKDYYESVGAALSLAAEHLDLVHPLSGDVFWLELGYAENVILSFPGYGPRVSGFLVSFIETKQLPHDHILSLVSEFGRRLSELV